MKPIEFAAVSQNGKICISKLLDAILYSKQVKCIDSQLYILTSDNTWHILGYSKQDILLLKSLFDEVTQSRLLPIQTKTFIEAMHQDIRFIRSNNTLNTTSILCLNGVIDLKSRAFTPIETADLKIETLNFLYSLNFKYIESIKEWSQIKDETWRTFLSSIFDNEQIEAFLQYLGYLLSPVLDAKKAVFIIGPPGCGKSTLLKFLRSVYPSTVTSTLDISYFSRYNSNGVLLNSLLNISSDVDAESKIKMGFYKRATSYEEVELSSKYVATQTVKLKTKFLFVGNALPIIPTAEVQPFIDRLLLLEMDSRPEGVKTDYTLFNKLLNSKDEIISLALNKFIDVYNNSYEFIIPQTTLASINAYISYTQSADAFVQDCLDIADKESFVRANDLWLIYELYCTDNALEIETKKRLFSILKNKLKGIYKKKNLSNKGFGNRYGFEGIRWKPSILKDLSFVNLAIYIHQGDKHE